MKRKLCIVSLLCVLGVMLSGCESQEQKEIKSLIKQLGNTANPWTVIEVRNELVHIGEPAVPALIKTLNDEDKWVRRRAAESLSQIGEPAKDTVPALREALSDEDSLVRVYAAQALANIDRHSYSCIDRGVE